MTLLPRCPHDKRSLMGHGGQAPLLFAQLPQAPLPTSSGLLGVPGLATLHPDIARECFFLIGDHLGFRGLPAPLYPFPCPSMWHASLFLYLTEHCCPCPCLMSLAMLLHAPVWP